MNISKLHCPSCNEEMNFSFCNKASGLSYVTPDKFADKVFLDKDLSEAGLRKLIPWKGEWHKSHICEACGIYTIEYSVSYSREDVEALINDLKKQANKTFC